MAEHEVLTQAHRVASLLTEAWNEELGEASIDTDVATGMAVGHAVSQGWIEPDPSFAPFLISAERFLESGGEAIDDD